MRKCCKSCGHGWFWQLGDGRSKCRRCGLRQSFRSAWQSCRLSEASKCKLLECFVFGVPAYRLRFRGPASTQATERFFLLIRRTIALLESCQEPLDGTIECDESSFGGHRKGKRGWGAGALWAVARPWSLVFSSATAWCVSLPWMTARRRPCCR